MTKGIPIKTPAVSALKELTSEAFVKMWTGSAKAQSKFIVGSVSPIIELKGFTIKGVVKIVDCQVQLPSIRFVDCKIEALHFTNTIAKNIYFNDGTEISKVDFILNSKIDRLVFDNNSTKTDLSFSRGSFCELLIVDNCKYFASLLVEDELTNVGDVFFTNSDAGIVMIDNRGSSKSLTIENSTIRTIKINRNDALETLTVCEKSTCVELLLDNATVSDHILIKEGSEINHFALNCLILPIINIKDSFIEDFDYNNSIDSTFNLRTSTVVTLLLEEMKTGKNGLIQLIDSYVGNLVFNTILNLASVNINNLMPFKLGQHFEFSRKKKGLDRATNFFKKTNYQSDSTIQILNSDMGKTMISSDLSHFDKFIFLNSKIVEMFISGPRLPDVLETVDPKELDNQKVVAYNQLKKIYENRGDAITPLKYHQLEMDTHRRILLANRNSDSRESSDSTRGERFQLFFNEWTNSHGTNWVKPMIETLVISIFLYTLYSYTLYGFDLNGDYLKAFKLVPYYFEFLNPTHKVDFVHDFNIEKNKPSESLALIIDFIGRLSIPILLFQGVQAFRKYGKK